MEYNLVEPIEYGGKLIETVTIQKPKGKALKKLPATDNITIEQLIPVAAVMCNEPEMFFDLLEASDFLAIFEIISDFLLKAQQVQPVKSSPA